MYYFFGLVAFTMYRLGVFSDTSMNGLRVGKIELQRGLTLHQNEFVASCVGFMNPFCTPMYLMMHENGQLALFKGIGKDSKSWIKAALKEEDECVENELLWQSGKQKIMAGIKKTVFLQEFEGAVLPDGSLAIVRGRKNRGTIVWSMSAEEVRVHPVLSKSIFVRNFR